MTTLISPTLADTLAKLTAAVDGLNAVAHDANPQINPLWSMLDDIKPADWNSPVRQAQDKTDGEDPYL